MSQTLAQQFATRLLDFRPTVIPAEALEAATTALIDTVAVTLLGADAQCSKIARQTFAQNLSTTREDGCRVYGSSMRCSVTDAAMLNGIASHADDFDDFTDLFGGHPSVPIIPALLALAEINHCSGDEILRAYIAGVETENRLAMGVHFHHYEKGWHPTSTLGVFGAAAAAATLLQLDHTQTVNALALAASSASGLKANFGSMTKPLHVGHCCSSGLQSALLAQNGFTGQADVFEAKQGFLEVYNGNGNYDIAPMLSTWFEPAVVVEPGASIKQFPCCGSTHQVAYMAMKLTGDNDFGIDQLSKIDLRVSAKRLPHTNNPDPRTGLEAKFSVQYVLARALLSGPLRLAHFEKTSYLDSDVRELMKRISVEPDPELGLSQSSNPFGADLTLTLDDGSTLNARTEHLAGRGGDFPMTRDELWEKFEDCTRRTIAAAQAQALFAQLSNFNEVTDFNDVAQNMTQTMTAATRKAV